MGLRTRTRTYPGSTGTVTFSGSVSTQSYNSLFQETTDTVGRWWAPNNFNSRTRTRSAVGMTGTWATRVFSNYPSVLVTTSIVPALSSQMTSTAMLVKAKARSNPSRKNYKFDQFVGELRDFPRMAKSLWETALPLAKKARKAGMTKLDSVNYGLRKAAIAAAKRPDQVNLAVQFGWKPFIEDHLNYHKALELAARRLDELEKFKKDGHRTRRTKLDTGSSTSKSTVTLSSVFGTIIKGRMTRVDAFDAWATSKWRLFGDSPVYRMDHKQLAKYAKSLAFGTTPGVDTLYHLYPWTWLIDWGTNLGQYIDGNMNTVGAYADYICLMQTTQAVESVVRTPGVDDAILTVTGGDFVNEVKIKDRSVHSMVVPLLPEATFPILTGKQMSILGSLMTTRICR